MEVLGRQGAAVQSVAASAAHPTAFVSLDATGAVTLWDLRLRRKNYCTIANPNLALGAEASEVVYFADQDAVLVMARDTLQVFDTRKTMQLREAWAHPRGVDWSAVLQGPPAPRAQGTLVVDDTGVMYGFDIRSAAPVSLLPSDLLGGGRGEEEAIKLPDTHNAQEALWGEGDDLCSGFGVVALCEPGRDEKERALFAIGMSGTGAVYTRDEGRLRRDGFTLAAESELQAKGDAESGLRQVINPPFVTCCGFQRTASRVAVGRGNGMYDVLDLTRDVRDAAVGVELCLSAPGHAMNALCAVDWLTPEILLTTSACGEVTGWAVGAFIACEDEEEGEELPTVCAAAHYREVTATKATVNCSTRLGTYAADAPRYVAGDTAGNVVLYTVELA